MLDILNEILLSTNEFDSNLIQQLRIDARTCAEFERDNSEGSRWVGGMELTAVINGLFCQ